MSGSNKRQMIDSIATLVRVKSSEVERMEADLARQEATRRRYQTSVEPVSAAFAEVTGKGTRVNLFAISFALVLAGRISAH